MKLNTFCQFEAGSLRIKGPVRFVGKKEIRCNLKGLNEGRSGILKIKTGNTDLTPGLPMVFEETRDRRLAADVESVLFTDGLAKFRWKVYDGSFSSGPRGKLMRKDFDASIGMAAGGYYANGQMAAQIGGANGNGSSNPFLLGQLPGSSPSLSPARTGPAFWPPESRAYSLNATNKYMDSYSQGVGYHGGSDAYDYHNTLNPHRSGQYPGFSSNLYHANLAYNTRRKPFEELNLGPGDLHLTRTLQKCVFQTKGRAPPRQGTRRSSLQGRKMGINQGGTEWASHGGGGQWTSLAIPVADKYDKSTTGGERKGFYVCTGAPFVDEDAPSEALGGAEPLLSLPDYGAFSVDLSDFHDHSATGEVISSTKTVIRTKLWSLDKAHPLSLNALQVPTGAPITSPNGHNGYDNVPMRTPPEVILESSSLKHLRKSCR